MEENAPGYAKEDVLALYLFTGGVAKYVELLLLNKALHLDAILDQVFTENSLFIEEVRIPFQTDPPFRFKLTPHSGQIDPL
jgi:hypothetical protein